MAQNKQYGKVCTWDDNKNKGKIDMNGGYRSRKVDVYAIDLMYNGVRVGDCVSFVVISNKATDVRKVLQKKAVKAGILYYQKGFYTQPQMKEIESIFKTRLHEAPRVLFVDNYVDRFRADYEIRHVYKGQSKVMGDYDREFGFGIPTSFANSYKAGGYVENVANFKKLMDKLFAELKTFLQKGCDIIVPAPLDSELQQQYNSKYYWNNKQVVFHKLGTGNNILALQLQLTYIQHHLDKLAKLASAKKIVRGTVSYNNYNYKAKKPDSRYQQQQHIHIQEMKRNDALPAVNDNEIQKLRKKVSELEKELQKQNDGHQKLVTLQQGNLMLRGQLKILQQQSDRRQQQHAASIQNQFENQQKQNEELLHKINETEKDKNDQLEKIKQQNKINAKKSDQQIELLTKQNKEFESINKELTGKINTFIQNQKSIKAELERNIKQNNELLNKYNGINKTKNELTQHLEEYKSKKSCYATDQLVEYKSTDKHQIVMRNEIKQKQTNIDTALDVHVNRLKDWNDFSINLKQEFEKVQNSGQQNDDEKKQQEYSVPVIALLNSFIKCTKALRAEQSRVEDIVEHVVSLSKSKKELKNVVKQYQVNVIPTQQKFDELKALYIELKSKREQLHGKISNMIQEINQITQRENTINMQKCETLNDLNVSVVEKEKYDQLLKKCKSLTAKYNKFETNVDIKADELQKFFDQKWDEHEQL